MTSKSSKKRLPRQRHRRYAFGPWVGKIPWRREWQPTPVFLPGESHGQRSLAGYCPWVRKESDMTEHSGAQRKVESMKYENIKIHIGESKKSCS